MDRQTVQEIVDRFDCDATERLAWTSRGVRAVQNRTIPPPGAVKPDLDAAGGLLA